MVLSFILLSPAAFFTAYLLGARMRLSRAARDWPRHPAKVLETSVSEHPVKGGGTLYKITVRCEYTIGHRRIVTEVLPSRFGTDRRGYARRLLAFFQVGATVPVYVDPVRPDLAVLLPGIDEREWVLFGLMLTAGVSTLIAAFDLK